MRSRGSVQSDEGSRGVSDSDSAGNLSAVIDSQLEEEDQGMWAPLADGANKDMGSHQAPRKESSSVHTLSLAK